MSEQPPKHTPVYNTLDYTGSTSNDEPLDNPQPKKRNGLKVVGLLMAGLVVGGGATAGITYGLMQGQMDRMQAEHSTEVTDLHARVDHQLTEKNRLATVNEDLKAELAVKPAAPPECLDAIAKAEEGITELVGLGSLAADAIPLIPRAMEAGYNENLGEMKAVVSELEDLNAEVDKYDLGPLRAEIDDLTAQCENASGADA